MRLVPLQGVRGCIFDAYGTLFDFTSATSAYKDILGHKFAALTSLWRDKQLQYTWLLSAQGRHEDFYRVTANALDFALESLEIDAPALREGLLELYMTLEPFPEVPDVLRRLKAGGIRLAILSNGTPEMLRSAVASAGFSGLFDAVISVEEVGAFKPASLVYQRALNRIGLTVEEVSFQSSNAWDAHAASAFGMRTVWCNRYGQRRERLPGSPDREVTTLQALPQLVLTGGPTA
jgi:2-haloacid dehalogenase